MEGYLDVIMLNKAGFSEAVASLGTAIGEAHLLKLWRTCDEVILCLDGDSAGLKATKRAINIALSLISFDKKLSFIKLPTGMDPDDVINKYGSDFFQDLIDNRLSMSAAIWELEFDGKEFRSAEAKATLEKILLEYAYQIKENTLKSNYIRFFKDQIWQNLNKRNYKNNSSIPLKVNIEKYSVPDIDTTKINELDVLEKALCCAVLHVCCVRAARIAQVILKCVCV